VLNPGEFISAVSDFLSRGNERSLNVKRNILYSFGIKGVSIVVSFLLVPLTINYVTSERYGIWLTITSIVVWVSFFDIGLGNGLRNKFAEAKARGETEQARTYISTTYAILTFIIIIIWLFFIAINPLIDWTQILNSPAFMRDELKRVVFIVFSFFCLQFVFQLISTILTSDQKPAKASLYNLIGNILSLSIIFILTKTTSGSLNKLAFVLGGIPVMVLATATIYFFRGKYRDVRPSFKYINLRYSGELMNLGLKFFILQIASLIIYQTNNIIIAQLFGPSEVTVYNIAFRYFFSISMVFGIIITPFWSAFTEANTKGDIAWIRNTMKRLIQAWGLLSLAVLFMLLVSKGFYNIWVGKEIHIPAILSTVIAISVLVNTWCSVFAYYLNGVGKIKIQIYSGLFGAVMNIPLAVFLGKLLGIEGVVLAGIFLGLISAVWAPVQYFKLISNTAKGIWNK
jgi:O-antigen/teichoic acid export membrane protein